MRALALVFLCASVQMPFTHRKRHATSTGNDPSTLIEDLEAQVTNLTRRLRVALDPVMPSTCFDMQDPAARLKLIDWLWAGDYIACLGDILDANPEVEEQLQQQTRSKWHATEDGNRQRRRSRINIIAALLARNKNKFMMPRHLVLLGIEAKQKMLNHVLWEQLSAIRVLPSRRWIDILVTDALEFNPGPPYEVIDWVTAAVFDNYSTCMNYSAAHNADTQGTRIDMTNWASLSLPLSTARHITVTNAVRAANPSHGMFKPGFDKYSVVELCHPFHPELVEYRTRIGGITQSRSSKTAHSSTDQITHHLWRITCTIRHQCEGCCKAAMSMWNSSLIRCAPTLGTNTQHMCLLAATA